MSPAWLLGLVALCVCWLLLRRGRWKVGIERWVKRRLGGYRHLVREADASLPRQVQGSVPRVAVVGGGLAGIAAASALGERGLDVTLLERNAYLGGKIGAWKAPVGDGEQTIDHGFHAFFRQYYNLNRFLDALGLRRGFKQIEDYLIVDDRGNELSYGDVDTAPLLNIVDLGRRGFYRWRDVIAKRTRSRLMAFLQFDMTRTYEAFDAIPFDRFCDEAALPDDLRVSFRTFARAFFSNETELSTADVLRAFHFYYLGHDQGLMYDYPAGDYESTLLSPIRAHLEKHGVDIRMETPVGAIGPGEVRRFSLDGEEYDWLVLAADIPGAQSIVSASSWISDTAPAFADELRALRTSHGYAVWRIWVDKDVRSSLPTFINVERKRLLDSVTLYHRITEEASAWALRAGGAVLELHSYAIPAGMTREEEVREVFLEELGSYFPELQGLHIENEVLQIRRDFPAFAPGQREHRPGTDTPIRGLLMAGDWIRLPYPMTHMEAAFTSGLLCANRIFDELALQAEPIFSVAPTGLLARRPTSTGSAHAHPMTNQRRAEASAR